MKRRHRRDERTNSISDGSLRVEKVLLIKTGETENGVVMSKARTVNYCFINC